MYLAEGEAGEETRTTTIHTKWPLGLRLARECWVTPLLTGPSWAGSSALTCWALLGFCVRALGHLKSWMTFLHTFHVIKKYLEQPNELDKLINTTLGYWKKKCSNVENSKELKTLVHFHYDQPEPCAQKHLWARFSLLSPQGKDQRKTVHKKKKNKTVKIFSIKQ